MKIFCSTNVRAALWHSIAVNLRNSFQFLIQINRLTAGKNGLTTVKTVA